MPDNQKFIAGLKHFKIRYLTNRNFELIDGPMGQIEIEAIQFNDGIFLGKVDYPFSLVVGRFVEDVGFDMIILDTEEGTLPLRAMATYANEGMPDRFYGTFDMIGVSRDGKYQSVGDAIISVELDCPMRFKYESASEVYKETEKASQNVIDEQRLNNTMYQSMLNSPPDAHCNNIRRFYQSINSQPLNESFHFLDSCVFDDEDE